MKTTFKYLYTIVIIVCSASAYGQAKETIISPDPPRVENKQLLQALNYRIAATETVRIHLACFGVHTTDTTRLYDYWFDDARLNSGIHSLDLNLNKPSRINYQDNTFISILKDFDLAPPGNYLTRVSVITPDSSFVFEKDYYLSVDSTLAYNSGLRNKVNHIIAGKKTMPTQKSKTNEAPPTDAEVQHVSNKVGRRLARSYGVNTEVATIDGATYACLYRSGWFLGRYEIKGSKALKQSIAREEGALQGNASGLVSNNLEGFTSVGSQVRKLYRKDKQDKDEDLSGDIDLSTYFSNGREPGSMEDRNYEELHGALRTKIVGLPVEIEGYYTTQDIGRKVKASYLRLHYDVDEQKGELSGMIRSYKSKYAETAAKGKGMESIGNSYLNSMAAEKNKLLYGLGKEYGIDENSLMNSGGDISKLLPDTAGVLKSVTDKARTKAASDTTLSDKTNKLEEDRKKLKKKYDRLVELNRQIGKYRALLEQFRNQNYLDSALNYTKVSKLPNDEDLSYKQLAKAGEGLLPKGKASRLVSGITHLDAGIINKYESDYTVSGQTIKGGSLGYDFNFVQLGLTAGKTEYISRDGNIDRYSSYLLRADFKPVRKQKVAFIYYNYSPSKQMLRDDNFFKDKDISYPSFKNPIHIFSLTYDGTVTQYVSIHSEGATSYRPTDNKDLVAADHGALKTSLECMIPRTPASVSGEWEHVGRNFQNSVLPYTKAATERYTLSGRSDFFRSFLSVGIQYNYLKQASFSTTGYSTKWGFDLQTHSRRWPSVSVSYKPFATFRTYTDTLNIPQRPLTGAVWIAKGSYQLKGKDMSHRFMLIYNQNSSTADTEQYSSKMFQLSYILTNKLGVFNANAGWMQLPLYQTGGYASANSYFFSINGGGNIQKTLRGTIGEEIGIVRFGLQRTATTIGLDYLLQKLSLTLRMQMRYTNFKQDEFSANKNLMAGQLGINWRFKTKASVKRHL